MIFCQRMRQKWSPSTTSLQSSSVYPIFSDPSSGCITYYRHGGPFFLGLLVKELWGEICLDPFPVLFVCLFSTVMIVFGVFVGVPALTLCSSLFVLMEWLRKKKKRYYCGQSNLPTTRPLPSNHLFYIFVAMGFFSSSRFFGWSMFDKKCYRF